MNVVQELCDVGITSMVRGDVWLAHRMHVIREMNLVVTCS